MGKSHIFFFWRGGGRKALPGRVPHEAGEEEELSRARVHPGLFANDPSSGASEERNG